MNTFARSVLVSMPESCLSREENMSQIASRVLDLMVAVARSDEPIGLMGLARTTGIDKSTASRLLRVLRERGLVARVNGSRLYQAGPELVALLMSQAVSHGFSALCAPVLTELQQACEETVSLHIPRGGHRVCVGGVESTQAVRRVVPWGVSLPLYLGPSGKVILAYMASDVQEATLAGADRAGLDVNAIRAQLADIRACGFALTVGDRTPGIRALSACVDGPTGPVASVTVAGPDTRWTDTAARSMVPRLLAATHAISVKLRYSSSQSEFEVHSTLRPPSLV